MELADHNAYVKKIVFYLSRKEYDLAFSLSKQFVAKFPNKLLPHFFLSKSAFWVKNIKVAIEEANSAFNLSKGEERATTGILLASAYYLSEDYQKGYLILKEIEVQFPNDLTREFKELSSIYSLTLKNPQNSEKYVKKLYALNEGYAEAFIFEFLE